MDAWHRVGVFWPTPGRRRGHGKRPNQRQLGAAFSAALRRLQPVVAGGRSAVWVVCVWTAACVAVVRSLRTLPLRGRSVATNSSVLLGRRRGRSGAGTDGRHVGHTAECRQVAGAGACAVQLVRSGVGRSARH